MQEDSIPLPLHRFRRLVGRLSSPWAATALAVLLCSPALGIGLLADDHLHRAKVLHDPLLPYQAPPLLDLFVFFPGTDEGNQALVDVALLPWWAPEGLKASFLRPLSAATHVLDSTLWPDTPWLMHLHSLLWLAAVVLAAAHLFRHLGGSTAPLALLLFALDDCRASAAAWVANRNALVTLLLGIVALAAHDAWRRQGRPLAAPLALLAFAGALLSGEVAFSIAAYLGAHLLLLDRAPWARRVAAGLPYALLTGAWLLALRAGGFGTAGSDAYVDPVGAPLSFAGAVLERVPLLWLGGWLSIPSDLWVVAPRAVQLSWSLVGLTALLATIAVIWPVLRCDPLARFWGLGTLGALIPVCAAFPMDRLLVAAGLGSAALIAILAGRVLDPGDAPPTRAYRAVVLLLLAMNLAVALPLTPARVLATGRMLGMFDASARDLPDDPALGSQRLVFVNAVEFEAFYTRLIRTHEGRPAPAHADWLAHPTMEFDLHRPDERSLVVRSEPGFLADAAQALCRSNSLPFAPGETIERPFMTVVVDEVTADGRPAVVTFRFDAPLEAPSLRFVVWQEGELRAFELPAVGETVRLLPTIPTLK